MCELLHNSANFPQNLGDIGSLSVFKSLLSVKMVVHLVRTKYPLPRIRIIRNSCTKDGFSKGKVDMIYRCLYNIFYDRCYFLGKAYIIDLVLELSLCFSCNCVLQIKENRQMQQFYSMVPRVGRSHSTLKVL